MPVARPESSDARVIAHVDMDCFYVQVEQRKQPQLRGLPTAVVQYNEWKGGALIAVSYEARKFGVTRHMRGDEAKEVCPQIQLVQVPVARGKADLNAYRDAGSEVVSILSKKGRCERASIDEVYLDLTDAAETMLAEASPESLEEIDDEALKSHVLGIKSKGPQDGIGIKDGVRDWICRRDADHRDKLLACGILIVAELRKQVLKETEFTCSAGIAHNKMLAKLASGMNKPAQQTVVPYSSVQGLLNSLPIKKMKQLGGKLGTSLQIDLGVNTVGDLLQFTETRLQELYGINTGTWLWYIARGISGEEVQDRLLTKSHGSGKLFPGPRALKTISTVQHWLNQLCEELSERICSDLEQNRRIASTLTLHARAYKSSDSDSNRKFPSKSCPLRYGTSKIQEDAFNLFQAALREYMGSSGAKTQGNKHSAWGVTALSVSASKIVDLPSGTSSIMKYFPGQCTSSASSKQLSDNLIQEGATISPSVSESGLDKKSRESEIELSAEDTWIKSNVSGSSKHEEDRDMCKEQDTCCTSKRGMDLLIQSTGPPLLSGFNQSTQTEISKDDQQIRTGRKERKRNIPKEKVQGMPSIVDFFKNYNATPSSLDHRRVAVPEDRRSPSYGNHPFCILDLLRGNPSKSCVAGSQCQNEDKLQNESFHVGTGSNSAAPGTDQIEERRETWGYNTDEIDQSVVDELPPEIQQEIRAWLRPHKRPNAVKGGSTIAHYFLPMKDA